MLHEKGQGTRVDLSDKKLIIETIIDVTRKITGDNEVEINTSTAARDVKGWDSLAHIQIILDLEKKFGIRLRAGEVAKLTCVGDLVDIILIKKAEQ